MKSRRWIAAAALAAAAVFLVMVTGEHAPSAPEGVPAPVASSGAVLASDGGPPDDDATGADRAEVIDALQGLLDALGISAQELADCADSGEDRSEPGGGNGNGNGNGNANGNANGNGCGQQGAGAAAEPTGAATITITAFAFGQPLTVDAGATVEVVNGDAAPHNVTAADGSFETPDLAQNETATFTAPTTPGRYQFTCTLHPEMTGILVVADDAAGSGTGARTGEQGRSRPPEPGADSQRSGTGAGNSGGQHDNGRSQQHETKAPSTGRGTSDGY